MLKIVSRIKGGLGNQLFCYAASRRIALVNNAELVIDDVTGFVRDRLYRRQYALDHFHIPIRKATPSERMEPFERYRRGAKKWFSSRKLFAERSYLEQEGLDFDERLLGLNVKGTLYLDGLWQSEGYFKDVEHVIRDDLRIIQPTDMLNQNLADDIRQRNSVALHVRWFDTPGTQSTQNVSVDYYKRSISFMDSRIVSPHYFVFSDDPCAAQKELSLPQGRVTFVSHNIGDENSYADLWLMSLCSHFITANSTFSWWGAWLGACGEKIVVSPNLKIDGTTAWGFAGLIPAEWIVL